MADQHLLTIGIPTYNRPDRLCRVLADCVGEGALDQAEILVIDDGPTEGLRQRIAEISGTIRFQAHDRNRGYAETFAEIISSARTPFVMLSADDDAIAVENLGELIHYLRDAEPDFVSTNCRDVKGNLVRGQPGLARITLGKADFAGHHAPGLVYRCAKARRHLGFLQQRLDAGCNAAHLFPQLAVIYLMLLEKSECHFHTVEAIRPIDQMPTNLRDFSGDLYISGPSRWRRQRAFSNFFSALAELDLSSDATAAAQALKKLHDQEVFVHIRTAFIAEYGQLNADWNGGALFYTLKRPVRAVIDLVQWIHQRFVAHWIVDHFDDDT